MTSEGAPDLEVLAQTARAIVPSWVSIAVSDPREPSPPLMKAELAATTNMVPKRLREFAAGRHAARQAMQKLGLEPAPIRMGPDRAPIWPQNAFGSVSHCETACIAALTLRNVFLGVDVELCVDLDTDLVDLVCFGADLEWCNAMPSQRLKRARQIFVAKEAVYKAQYPRSKEVLEFSDIEIFFCESGGRFLAVFKRDVGSIQQGDEVWGHLEVTPAHILAVVAQPILGKDKHRC